MSPVFVGWGVPVHVLLFEENDFKPSANDVTSLVTDRSRVMILNYPNNVTGLVLSYDEVVVLSKIAVERDLVVISDEVWESIMYDGAKHYYVRWIWEKHRNEWKGPLESLDNFRQSSSAHFFN